MVKKKTEIQSGVAILYKIKKICYSLLPKFCVGAPPCLARLDSLITSTQNGIDYCWFGSLGNFDSCRTSMQNGIAYCWLGALEEHIWMVKRKLTAEIPRFVISKMQKSFD